MEFWKWPKDMCSCIIPMNSQIWTCETVNLFCLNFPRKLHQTPGTYPRPSTTCLFQEIPSYLYFGVPGVCSIFCLCTIPKHEHASSYQSFWFEFVSCLVVFPESPRFRGSKNRHSEVTTPLPVKADTPTMLLVTKAQIFPKHTHLRKLLGDHQPAGRSPKKMVV